MFDDWYRDFTSNVSYYDFRFQESDPVELDLASRRGLAALQKLPSLEPTSLAALLQTEPSLLFALQKLLRDQRFRNGQWIYFLFDIAVLNRPQDPSVQEYVSYNLAHDGTLREMCANVIGQDPLMSAVLSGGSPQTSEDWATLISGFKRSLILFIKKPGAIRKRLANPDFAPECQRIANYLITQMGLAELTSKVDLTAFAQWKRRPRDIRTIHGRFGQDRVQQALENRGFTRRGSGDGRLEYDPQGRLSGVVTKAGRDKVFDFLLYQRGSLKAAVETNFFESEGTKIGINAEEYIDLAKDVGRRTNADFIWVTDGSVWLTTGRRDTLRQLFDAFHGHVYNYNTFERELPSIVASWTR